MPANALVWGGGPGHYEVYYLTCTDRATGTGLWIRYTMKAPTDGPAECSLWFLAMRADGWRHGFKETFPIERLVAEAEPFSLRVGDALLTDGAMSGAVEGARWDLHWEPRLPAAQVVHPFFRSTGIAKTIFCVPHPDVQVSGTVEVGGETLTLDGVQGGQAHLWGTKHANRWTWVHCNDFATLDGQPRPDTFWEGVSVFVPRFGREIGPSSPIVARVLGEDFSATAPWHVTRTTSAFGLTQWRNEAVAGRRKLVAQVDAPRPSLVGVTYQDPDGDHAYCYNSEVATMRLQVWDKISRRAGWTLRDTLLADGTAHFEYAQRTPVEGVELLTR